VKNKKLALSVLSTAVVGSMASSAFAIENGIYIGGDVDQHYGIANFIDKVADEPGFINVVNSNVRNIVFVNNKKGINLYEFISGDETDLYAALRDLTPADFDADEYTLDGGAKWKAADDPDLKGEPAGELKVESVSAINANEIKLVFSKELNETSAETETNYQINGAPLVAGQDTVTLEDGGKSVVIRLGATGAVAGGSLTNNTAYTILIEDSLEDAEGNDLGVDVSKPLFFSDSTKPTVSQVTTLENGNLRIKFSERHALNPGAVFINGQSVNLATAVSSDDTYNGYLTIPKAAIDAATTIEAGKSYSIVVSGIDDLAGNTMDLYSGTFTYGANADAPTVTGVTAKGETVLEVTMSEPVQAAAFTATQVKVFKGLTDLGIANGDITNPSDDGKTWRIALPTTNDVLFDSSKNETSVALTVKINGYKDLAGNVGVAVERNITVSKDTSKPTIVKAQYTHTPSAPADNTLTLTLSEAGAAANAAALQGATVGANFYITDTNGVRYDVAAPAITDDLAGGTDKTIKIDLDTVGITTNGNYTLHVAAGAFTDQALNGGNANAAQSVTFEFTGAANADKTKPTVAVTTGANNGQITATYNEAVKGGNVAGSATDVANYKLNGASLPAGTTITLDATRTVATITLPAGYVSTTATHVLTVSNVQDLAGNVINTNSQTVTVNENKSPELTAARVVNGELVLTFSENVDTAVSLDFSDFEVKINGVDVNEAAGSLAASLVAANQFNISVTDASLATGTITVKVLNSADATDATGNAIVKNTTVTASR